MHFTQLRETDQLFSHYSPDEGVWRHFNASAICRDITSGKIKPKKATIEIPKSLVRKLHEAGTIDSLGLARAAQRKDLPVILAEFPDGTSILVDGNHRVAYRYSIGLKDALAYLLQPQEWDPYLLKDLPPKIEQMLIQGMQQATGVQYG